MRVAAVTNNHDVRDSCSRGLIIPLVRTGAVRFALLE